MKNLLKECGISLLVLLFVYAAVSKLIDFDEFHSQLYNQAFSHALADVLQYLLPSIELLAAGLLILPATRVYGLGLSLLLMVVFTGYITLALLHWWPRLPCSCGGVLRHLSWRVHLAFNLFFLFLNTYALHAELREQG